VKQRRLQRSQRQQQQLSAQQTRSMRLCTWECAQQKQQRKKFRLWKITHTHAYIFTAGRYIVIQCERVRATICITFVRGDSGVATLPLRAHRTRESKDAKRKQQQQQKQKAILLQFCYCLRLVYI